MITIRNRTMESQNYVPAKKKEIYSYLNSGQQGLRQYLANQVLFTSFISTSVAEFPFTYITKRNSENIVITYQFDINTKWFENKCMDQLFQFLSTFTVLSFKHNLQTASNNLLGIKPTQKTMPRILICLYMNLILIQNEWILI